MLPRDGEQTGAILVVEDEPSIRQAMQWVLEEEGLPVQTAGDGREALDLAVGAAPALVVLDMALPRLDGRGVASGLRARFGERIPMLVVTADGRAEAKARQIGAYAYLEKPFDLMELVRVVRQGLESR